MSGRVEVSRGTIAAWVPSEERLAKWAEEALGRRRGSLCIRIVAPRESRQLNAAYRGCDYATNVLAFPAGEQPRGEDMPLLGDIAICASVVAREARAQGKSERAHWAHLVVHGTLHLVGYDHQNGADASRMERREIAVLRRLGFPNPYRATPAPPRRRSPA